MNYPQPDSLASHAPAISRMGRFYITRELGRGTIAAVYLGHDPVIDRAVASIEGKVIGGYRLGRSGGPAA